MPTGTDRPWHELLVDDEHAEHMADLKRDSVGPLATIKAVRDLAGKDEDGNWRLHAFNNLYESWIKLPTSVNAKRAELAAQALAHDPWKPKPSSREWDPDQRQGPPPPGADEGDADPGLPRRRGD